MPGLGPFIDIVIAISVIIGFIVIFQSMYTAVMERTREIGILKSLGATRLYIVNVVLRESLLLAIAGVLLGLLLTAGWKRGDQLQISAAPRGVGRALGAARDHHRHCRAHCSAGCIRRCGQHRKIPSKRWPTSSSMPDAIRGILLRRGTVHSSPTDVSSPTIGEAVNLLRGEFTALPMVARIAGNDWQIVSVAVLLICLSCRVLKHLRVADAQWCGVRIGAFREVAGGGAYR